ncbi:hypothetical protein [Sphingorhabdus sp.]
MMNITPSVTPAQAEANRACRSGQTQVMGTSLRWGDGGCCGRR